MTELRAWFNAPRLHGEWEIRWEDCRIDHYENNNGVVLHHDFPSAHQGQIVVFIDGAIFGFDRDTPLEAVIPVVEPLMRMAVAIYNRGLNQGRARGDADARAEIRKALGVA